MTNNCQQLRPFMVVAIDGGAASGKSSTSVRLAERCNFLHVDTGNHYRTLTHAIIREGLSHDDPAALRPFLGELRLGTLVVGHECLMCREGEAPLGPDLIRSGEVNALVSPVAAVPEVRDALRSYQRSLVQVARTKGFAGIVMDGRDIGTVILPDADLKVFLKADVATRQRRRELEGATDAIGDRDQRDASRATAPLKPASDAVIIDNSNIGLEEVVEQIIGFLPGGGTDQ
ncbi:MAG: (d)CMP kinase [Opitutales bacterium]|jgi:cytidylate kinase